MAEPLIPDLLEADDAKLLAVVAGYYHAALKDSAEATAYLHKRGITHPGVAVHFNIGYSDRSLGTKLPSKDGKAGRELRARLERLGVFRESGHEHFRGSITVPILAADGTGRVTDLYGRKVLGAQLRKGTPLDTHLNDERRGVFNVGAFGAANEVVLCTSVFDALTFWTHGYRNATATFGAY